MRHLFFAERPAAKPVQKIGPGLQSVAVIGAEPWAAASPSVRHFRARGGDDRLRSPPRSNRPQRVTTTIEASARKGRISAAAAAAAIGRVTGTRELAAVAPAALVIEAVFENMAVKQQVFRGLDRLCREDAVLATNTSTLDVDAIASATARPRSVVGSTSSALHMS